MDITHNDSAFDCDTSTGGWFNSTQAWSYWNRNDIAWGEVIEKEIQDEDIRFKNYYSNYTDCHKIFVITYPERILFCKMKQRIEFKGSYSRKHQRPRKLRGQRLF